MKKWKNSPKNCPKSLLKNTSKSSKKHSKNDQFFFCSITTITTTYYYYYRLLLLTNRDTAFALATPAFPAQNAPNRPQSTGRRQSCPAGGCLATAWAAVAQTAWSERPPPSNEMVENRNFGVFDGFEVFFKIMVFFGNLNANWKTGFFSRCQAEFSPLDNHNPRCQAAAVPLLGSAYLGVVVGGQIAQFATFNFFFQFENRIFITKKRE